MIGGPAFSLQPVISIFDLETLTSTLSLRSMACNRWSLHCASAALAPVLFSPSPVACRPYTISSCIPLSGNLPECVLALLRNTGHGYPATNESRFFFLDRHFLNGCEPQCSI